MRVHDYLDFFAREQPETECVVFEGRALTYRQMGEQSNQVANALIASGLEVGTRIGVLAKNCTEFLVLYYGAFKAGVVPVPLNYRLAPAEWKYILTDSNARMILARGEHVEMIEPLRAELPEVDHYIAIDSSPPENWLGWSDWVGAQPGARPERIIDETSDAYQMYTSGTTGLPKGAVVQHRAVATNLAQISSTVHLEAGERYLTVAPLYHAAAGITSFQAISRGGSVYIQEDFVPADVVRALSTENIAAGCLVPAMIQACLVTVDDVVERDYGQLRFVLYGASPIPEDTLRRAIEVFGCNFAQGYGMTETTAVLTMLSPADHQRALAEKPELLLSAGRPTLGTEVRIVDDDDQPVADGEIGEIIARGPQLMRQYWNLPEATEKALRNGWMHTGDAGIIDAEGYLFIQDRVKDMIVSGGENVYPREIENTLFDHPAIADAAVIGIPDDKWGEKVMAVVVLREGEKATEDEIIAHCRERHGSFKCPRQVAFVDELPRNPTGKVLKRVLREPYWKGHKRRVS
jgi:acyl-CoA synthetase (AMP-forming)/AMP-acid ligase II